MEEDDIMTQEEELDSDALEAPLAEDAAPSGKFDRLLGSDASKFKLSGMFRDWFLDYSSYVILQRAVPHVVDGLKPVQRRVLHAMFRMDDGAYTKVANIVGQAMQYHPHGDASILGALLQDGHVACVSGSAFGEGTCLRISYACSEQQITEAMQRIRTAVEQLR